MQDIRPSLHDGLYHSGSAQALYHPNQQVGGILNFKFCAVIASLRKVLRQLRLGRVNDQNNETTRAKFNLVGFSACPLQNKNVE